MSYVSSDLVRNLGTILMGELLVAIRRLCERRLEEDLPLYADDPDSGRDVLSPTSLYNSIKSGHVFQEYSALYQTLPKLPNSCWDDIFVEIQHAFESEAANIPGGDEWIEYLRDVNAWD